MGIGSTLARNTVLNVGTQAFVGALTFVAIPFVIRGIGDESFGLLSAIWMVVGYFSILDLGLSQASLKFLAKLFDNQDLVEANKTIVASLSGAAVLGLLASSGIVLGAPVLVERVFNISPGLRETAIGSLRIVALAVPLVMVQSSLRSVPMALQRFDLVNIIQATSGILQWGGSLILVLLHKGLTEITVLTVCIRLVTTVGSYLIVRRLVPPLEWSGIRDFMPTILQLFRFGSWVSVSQIVSPIVGYLDRVLIGAYLSMRAMAYYSVPSEALNKFQIIPLSLSLALFPAFAAQGMENAKSKEMINHLFARSLNYIVMIVLPISVVLAMFSRQILTVWIRDTAFADNSSVVFSLLSISFAVQALAYLPVTALQAIGKPKVTAKLYLAEIPVYIFLCFLLIPHYGIQGAASALLSRFVLITIALYVVAHFSLRGATSPYGPRPLRRALGLNALLAVLCFMIKSLEVAILLDAVLLVTLLSIYVFAAWKLCLDPLDRETFASLLTVRRK